MSARPDVLQLQDEDATKVHVRRVRPQDVTKDAETSEVRLIPTKAFTFDPDLSLHCRTTIENLGSTVAAEYFFPVNGAVIVPTASLVAGGAHLKRTPNNEHPILGPAHRSIFGGSLTPSKTDKANMRDVLMRDMVWVATPSQSN